MPYPSSTLDPARPCTAAAWSYSPGRLAITSDARLALSVWDNNNPRITGLRRSELGWRDLKIFTSWAKEGGAIAISPDDQVVLIGATNGDVRKYGLQDIPKSSLGPLLGTLPGPDAAELLFGCTADQAYAIGRDGRVWPFDVPSMTVSGTIMTSQPVPGRLFGSPDPDRTIQRNTHGAISPDGRYLVTNTGTDQLNVIDLATAQTTLLFTPAISQTFGVAFNYRLPGTALLAVHGYSVVAVYEFQGTSPLRLMASAAVPAQSTRSSHWGLLAWTGRGDGIIAAMGGALRPRAQARGRRPGHRHVQLDGRAEAGGRQGGRRGVRRPDGPGAGPGPGGGGALRHRGRGGLPADERAAVIEAAIRNLTSRSGTHIDKGLRTALAELQSPRHLERNMSVMILLTDGVQTGTPGEELRAAAEVRAAGVRLYTIGLGADVDAATLREMAGDDARYHFAPDSADLARIYAEIASDILCPAPAGGFWPGR
jgi:hypothetical protein